MPAPEPASSEPAVPGPPATTAGGIGIESAPRLELDQLLAQLIERAQDVMAAQNRLRGLLDANTMIIGDLELSVVLRRIVEAACRLVNARYGALGILAPVGGLEAFIHVGMDPDAVERIGHLPEGKGLLGALIDDPRPIRLRRIADDSRSVGFPAGHPPMSSFLGVPVRVRDEVFGNLYLSEAASGEFTSDDEQVATALAATAGVVIENARLFEQAHRRQEWLQASMQITRQLLAADGEEPLRLIARQARQIADADVVTVILPTPDPTRLMVEVAAGEGAERLTGFTYPIENTMAGLAFQTGRPVLVGDAAAETLYRVHLTEVIDVGPVMVVPLIGTEKIRGALALGRTRGRHRFDEADLDMATAFASHAAIALELADARADQQRVLLLEDRDRIARDLHDHVIQRLFASGLALQGVAARLGAGPQADRVQRVVVDLDATIAQVRSSIFGLRGALGPRTGTARARLLELVSELAPLLAFEPRVRFAGPVDLLVEEDLEEDLLAVARESLTNVARHAHATQVEIELSASSAELVLDVVDDGDGIGDTERRSGLANMQERAERRGGTLNVGPAHPDPKTGERKGLHLRWTIPLR
ncbi:MAG: GAF domain-containing protein [Sporichthyaceae bacterium]